MLQLGLGLGLGPGNVILSFFFFLLCKCGGHHLLCSPGAWPALSMSPVSMTSSGMKRGEQSGSRSPSSGTCDDADSEEIRAQIRRGVADAIEAGVTPRLKSILRLRHLGQNSRFPANSCLEILQEHPNSNSGEYWITNSVI